MHQWHGTCILVTGRAEPRKAANTISCFPSSLVPPLLRTGAAEWSSRPAGTRRFTKRAELGWASRGCSTARTTALQTAPEMARPGSGAARGPSVVSLLAPLAPLAPGGGTARRPKPVRERPEIFPEDRRADPSLKGRNTEGTESKSDGVFRQGARGALRRRQLRPRQKANAKALKNIRDEDRFLFGAWPFTAICRTLTPSVCTVCLQAGP